MNTTTKTDSMTAPHVSDTRIDALMASLTYTTGHLEGTTSTVATARLPSGFVVAVGHSACVSPANFDAEKGRQYAIKDAEQQARKKLWEFEGYALALRLEEVATTAPQPNSDRPAHQQRVMQELLELNEKRYKLADFMTSTGNPGSIYDTLPRDEQLRLANQLEAMNDYAEALHSRIVAFGVPA